MSERLCLDCGEPIVRRGRTGPWPRRCGDCNLKEWRRRQRERRRAVPRCAGVTGVAGDRCRLAGKFRSMSSLPVCGHHLSATSVLTFRASLVSVTDVAPVSARCPTCGRG